jgi:tetratricopeptide (TPR) repeat protein
MKRQLWTVTLLATLPVLLPTPAAYGFQRGGHGGGGGHVGGGGGGGGGGFRGGAVAGGFHPAAVGGFNPGVAGGFRPGGFTQSPSMTMPRSNFNPGVRAPVNSLNNNVGVRQNNVVNRSGNTINNNINNVNVNRTSVNRFGYNNLRPWNSGYVSNGNWNYNRPYNGYHNNWVNGYWPGHYGGYGYGGLGFGGLGYGGLGYGGWGYGLGFLSGLSVGGFGGWGLNPYSYGWGYSNYANPFYGGGYGGGGLVNQPLGVGVGGVMPTSYDYAQPLDTTASAPPDTVADPAVSTFDQAREAFKAGDYARALDLVDQTIKALPNDADAHEFRGATLFALGKYKDAAASLYAVLAAGPGWDWTTLISLYPGIEAYEAQLRALEQSRNEHPDDPSARFVLAYLYSCQGAMDAAAREYAELVKLLPNDPLIKRLGKISTTPADANPPADSPPANPTPDPAVAAAESKPPEHDITGTFKASPGGDTQITLTRNADGTFTWDVATGGKSKPIKGKSTYQGDILALSQESGPPLAGKVTWDGTDKFNFRLVGNGAEDPGLNFTR